MARQKTPPDKKMHSFGIAMTESEWAHLDALCLNWGLNRSQMVRAILSDTGTYSVNRCNETTQDTTK